MAEVNPFKPGTRVHWKRWVDLDKKQRESKGYTGVITKVNGDVCFLDYDDGTKSYNGLHFRALSSGEPPTDLPLPVRSNLP